MSAFRIYMTKDLIRSHAKADTLAIDPIVNDRDTCTFVIDSCENPSLPALQSGMPVFIVMYNETAGEWDTVFGGEIDSIVKTYMFEISNIRYTVSCVDFNSIMDRRLISERFTDMTTTQIWEYVISKYLAEENIELGIAPANPPILASMVISQKYASAMATSMQNATGLQWNIRPVLDISGETPVYHLYLDTFFPEESIFPTVLDSTNVKSLETNESRDSYRNVQYLKAGDDTSNVIEGELVSPQPDGSVKTFFTAFPIAEKPTLVYGGTTVSDTDVGIGGVDLYKTYYWNKGSDKITQDFTADTATMTLAIWYKGLVPILVNKTDPVEILERKEVEQGSGIYEYINQESDINNKNVAYEYASGLLDRFGDMYVAHATELRIYVPVGHLVQLVSTNADISGYYYVESAHMVDESGDLKVTANLLGSASRGTWVEFFRALVDRASQYNVNENDQLIKLVLSDDKRTRHGSYYLYHTDDPLVPYDGLVPSDILVPLTGAKITETVVYD